MENCSILVLLGPPLLFQLTKWQIQLGVLLSLDQGTGEQAPYACGAIIVCFLPARGSAIARIVGTNVRENPGFNHTVKMWVFEELVDGKKLTEIINETHENVKYLKGFTIPENVVS